MCAITCSDQVNASAEVPTFSRKRDISRQRTASAQPWDYLNPELPKFHLFQRSMHPTWAISRSHNSDFDKMSQHSLSIADSGKTIAVKRGDTLTIRLAENPTTGYRWSEPSLDNTGVTLQRSEFINSGGNATGAGGQRVLTVQAKNWDKLRSVSKIGATGKVIVQFLIASPSLLKSLIRHLVAK